MNTNTHSNRIFYFRATTLFLIIQTVILSTQAQHGQYFAKNAILGSSLTWKWTDTSDPAVFYRFNEYTWNVNIAVSLNKKMYLGLQLLNIYTKGSNQSLEKYKIYGVFAQYNLLRRTDHRFIVETSFNRGDFCTCGEFEPYRKNNLFYWGIGMGYDLPIIKKILPGLYIDLSFINYFLLSQVESKYNYTQYVLGLNYRFGKE